jgi:hypothetical protein
MVVVQHRPRYHGHCEHKHEVLARLIVEMANSGLHLHFRQDSLSNEVPGDILIGEKVSKTFSPFLCYDSRNLQKV